MCTCEGMHEHPLVADEGPRADVRFEEGPQLLSLKDVAGVEDPVAVRTDFLVLVVEQRGQESDCLCGVIFIAREIGGGRATPRRCPAFPVLQSVTSSVSSLLHSQSIVALAAPASATSGLAD